ncbi:MAG: peptide-N4-(N-acetyl-beta- glucosaminyl)asparagine amidase, partial [Chaenotheca gracillima]
SGGEQKQGGGGFLGGIGDKINSAAGGGKESEKNEDYVDKGVDYVQENVMGQGKQDNESAIEQAKDEQISDFIRGKYKSQTGSDIPIEDKS